MLHKRFAQLCTYVVNKLDFFLFSGSRERCIRRKQKTCTLKKTLKFFGKNRKEATYRGLGGRTAGAPLDPCHHFRPHKTDRGRPQGHIHRFPGIPIAESAAGFLSLLVESTEMTFRRIIYSRATLLAKRAEGSKG